MRMRSTAGALVSLLVSGAAVGHAQSLLTRPTIQHATVATSSSAAAAVAGTALTLWADVAPNPSIHIYAEGAKDFSPVSLVIGPNASIGTGKPTYPKPDVAFAPGATDAVPAYTRPFRIAVPVTIMSTAKKGQTVTIAGSVNYQACDDRLCYPVSVAPVTWKVLVR
jgi:DsbC/DsbD-like thiol-disulfide interchange protein